MISGIKNTFDDRHLERLKYENKTYGGNTEIIKVKTNITVSHKESILVENLCVIGLVFLLVPINARSAGTINRIKYGCINLFYLLV